MPVYVDNMKAPFGNMIMCHMIADTTEELLSMCRKIGVQTRWIQHRGTPDEHFDIALSKRRLAVQHGAIEITMRQLGAMSLRKRVEDKLGTPEEAEAWCKAYLSEKRKKRNQ